MYSNTAILPSIWECLICLSENPIMTEGSAKEEPLQTRQEAPGPSRGDFEKAMDDTRIPPMETSEREVEAETAEKQPAQAASHNQSDPPSSIRSRISRRSTSEKESEHTNSAERAVRDQVEEEGLIRRTPLYRSPIPGKAERWHEEVDTPSQWTSLFYGVSH